MSIVKRRHAQPDTAKGRALRLLVLSAVVAAALPFASAMAQENAKWFVLRHDQTNACWTGLLIKVNGAYQHAFAQKAGGPYDTQAQAMQREKALEQNGVCTKTAAP